MKSEVVIIGAGAAGLFCASLLGQQGYNVTVIDNGKRMGRKIIISGGGHCNFTNMIIDPSHYISSNPHFCKSALRRFTQWDFLALIARYKLTYHEREHGRLFLNEPAQALVNLLDQECQKGNVNLLLKHEVTDISQYNDAFQLITPSTLITTKHLIVATGGVSMPKLGATPIGYKIAKKMNIPIVPIRAGLVPFTLHKKELDLLKKLAGISLPVTLSTRQGVTFSDHLLFTHRGLSGPAILQISNYWQPSDPLFINLLPHLDLHTFIHEKKRIAPQQTIKQALLPFLPKRLLLCLIELGYLPESTLGELAHSTLLQLANQLEAWTIYPNGTEGYRTAEVTLGGVDTHALSSQTMMAIDHPNLYFIGETVDVTGWLGGYNFQWAWSSAWACANSIITRTS